MVTAHPLKLLVIWMLTFTVNSLLVPIYLMLFGPLGAILLLCGILLLIVSAIFMTYNAVFLARRSNRFVLYTLSYAIAPILIMVVCGLFFIHPLAELSYVSIYGPRNTIR